MFVVSLAVTQSGRSLRSTRSTGDRHSLGSVNHVTSRACSRSLPHHSDDLYVPLVCRAEPRVAAPIMSARWRWGQGVERSGVQLDMSFAARESNRVPIELSARVSDLDWHDRLLAGL